MFSQIAHNIENIKRTEDVHIRDNIDFNAMLLSEHVLQGLLKNGFKKPSPIQLKAIPMGRCGFDLIIKAKSGTGKTAVFGIIALEMINVNSDNLQVLILAPTREIAVQIQQVLLTIGVNLPGLKIEYFIGGTPLEEDTLKLKNCHIAVGAPGRVKHLIKTGAMKLDSVRLFVLDEADKLVQSSYQTDINYIYNKLSGRKQIIASSATYPDELDKFLAKYMTSPTHISPNSDIPVLLGIRQFVSIVDSHLNLLQQTAIKMNELIRLLRIISFTQCIVFSNYQTRAATLSNNLQRAGWPCLYISGAQKQQERLDAVSSLKEFKCRILSTTDLTARGIDAANVDLVINYEVPHDAETYLHRMGRAGRYGSAGICITIAADGSDVQKLQKILGSIGGGGFHVRKYPKLEKPGDNTQDIWTCDMDQFEKLPRIAEEKSDTPEIICETMKELSVQQDENFEDNRQHGDFREKIVTGLEAAQTSRRDQMVANTEELLDRTSKENEQNKTSERGEQSSKETAQQIGEENEQNKITEKDEQSSQELIENITKIDTAKTLIEGKITHDKDVSLISETISETKPDFSNVEKMDYGYDVEKLLSNICEEEENSKKEVRSKLCHIDPLNILKLISEGKLDMTSLHGEASPVLTTLEKDSEIEASSTAIEKASLSLSKDRETLHSDNLKCKQNNLDNSLTLNLTPETQDYKNILQNTDCIDTNFIEKGKKDQETESSTDISPGNIDEILTNIAEDEEIQQFNLKDKLGHLDNSSILNLISEGKISCGVELRDETGKGKGSKREKETTSELGSRHIKEMLTNTAEDDEDTERENQERAMDCGNELENSAAESCEEKVKKSKCKKQKTSENTRHCTISRSNSSSESEGNTIFDNKAKLFQEISTVNKNIALYHTTKLLVHKDQPIDEESLSSVEKLLNIIAGDEEAERSKCDYEDSLLLLNQKFTSSNFENDSPQDGTKNSPFHKLEAQYSPSKSETTSRSEGENTFPKIENRNSSFSQVEIRNNPSFSSENKNTPSPFHTEAKNFSPTCDKTFEEFPEDECKCPENLFNIAFNYAVATNNDHWKNYVCPSHFHPPSLQLHENLYVEEMEEDNPEECISESDQIYDNSEENTEMVWDEDIFIKAYDYALSNESKDNYYEETEEIMTYEEDPNAEAWGYAGGYVYKHFEQTKRKVKRNKRKHAKKQSYLSNAMLDFDTSTKYDSYFDYYDNMLAENASHFTDVPSFEKWFQRWQENVFATRNYVQQEIFSREVLKKNV